MMIKTLEIIDTVDVSDLFDIGNKVYTRGWIIDHVIMYTERPDGTWYSLTIDVRLYRTLLKMLGEGQEPYLVFEIIAL